MIAHNIKFRGRPSKYESMINISHERSLWTFNNFYDFISIRDSEARNQQIACLHGSRVILCEWEQQVNEQ